MARSKSKRIRPQTKALQRFERLTAITTQALISEVEALPWDEWKAEFITRRNDDGSWYYRHIRHFASVKFPELNIKNLAERRFIDIVSEKCGPFDLINPSKRVVEIQNRNSDRVRYHSDWQNARLGYDWKIEAETAQADLLKIDKQIYLLQRSDWPLQHYKAMMNHAMRMAAVVEQHFEGVSLLEDQLFPKRLAPRPARNESESDLEIRKAEYEMLQEQERMQKDRFDTYCAMHERIQKFYEAAAAGYRKCLEIGAPKIIVNAQQNNANIGVREDDIVEATPVNDTELERMTKAFLNNAAETMGNFEFEPPKALAPSYESGDDQPIDVKPDPVQ